MSRPCIRFIRLANTSLFDQLKYEEMLLRHNTENWCIVSNGPSKPHIVLGLSGKIDQLVNIPLVARDDVPLIRRFSGGGTVIVDSSTIFVTFIINTKDVNTLPYPRDIMQWTETVYAPVFHTMKSPIPFSLRENDYVFGDLKIGGNAQSIVRDRWLHHTSFLWNYSEENMNYLQLPTKRPEYRGSRSHSSFLTSLSLSLPPASSPSVFIEEIEREIWRKFVVNREREREREDDEDLRRELEREREKYVSFVMRSSRESLEKFL